MPGGNPKKRGSRYRNSLYPELTMPVDNVDYDDARMAWRLSQPAENIRGIAADYLRITKAGGLPSDCEIDAWAEAQRRGLKIGSGRPKASPGVEDIEGDEFDFLGEGQESPVPDEPTDSITSPIAAITDEPDELLGAGFDLLDQLDHPMIAR